MFSIDTLLGVLGGVTDSVTIVQSVRRRLQNLSTNKIYIDLLDEQFRNERTHTKLDISLDKKKMKQAMREYPIDLRRAPLQTDELDNAIGDSIVEILMKGVVTSGSSTLDEHRARTIVMRVHEHYFEKVKEKIPELVEVLQHQEVIHKLNAQSIALNNLLLGQSQQSRVLNQIIQTTNEISDAIQHASLQIEHSKQSHETNQQEILAVYHQLTNLVAPSNSRITFAYVASADAPPQFGDLYTNRTELIESILELLNRYDWVGLKGQTGSGKTGLAAIVHATRHYQARWISFFGYEGNEARDHLYKQILLWSTELLHEVQSDIPDHGLNLEQLTDTIASRVPKGLIIWDNLPDPANSANDLLYQDLRQIGLGFSRRNIPILSTGQRGLPSAITSTLSTFSLDAPPLLSGEIAEILQSAKATEYYLRESTVTYIKAVTKGLVALVVAYIVWYQRHNWPQNAQFIESILSDEPGIELREEHQRKLYRLLEANAIELLSRLSLLVSDFDSTLVNLVAQIPGEILQPHFVFSELKNVWIAQLEADRYQVSPLLKDIGRKNLSVEKQRLVASSVADFYMRERQPIDIDDVLNISLYLWSASRQSDYAMFVVQALVQVTTASQAKYLGWAVFVPSPEIGFSIDVPVSLQIILRTQQLRVAFLGKVHVDDIVMELERLISAATDKDTGAVIYAYVMTDITQASSLSSATIYPFEVALRRTFQALSLLQENPTAFEQVRRQFNSDVSTANIQEYVSNASDVGNLVWLWMDKVNSQDRALLFLDQIYGATKEVRDVVFGASLASGTLPFIIDQLWFLEEKKPAELQDRNGLIRIYDRALQFAEQHDIPALRVAGARAKAITLSDIEQGLNGALPVMESLPPTDDNDLVAWINITLALLHHDFGVPENARVYLERAIGTSGAVADQWRFTMRKHLAVAYSKLDLWREAKQQAILALKDAQGKKYEAYSRLEMLGELAFIHWNLNDAKRACGTLYALYAGLQSKGEFSSSEHFNEIYNKFAHATGWYANFARNFQETLGDYEYHPVEAGYFARSLPPLRTYRREYGNTLVGPAVLLLIMAVEADAHGIAWGLWRQVKQSEDLEGTFFRFFTYSYGASLEARFGSPFEAVKCGVVSFKLKGISQSAIDLNRPMDVFQQISIEKAWSRLSESQQASYEARFVNEVLAPLFIKLLATERSKTRVVDIFREYRLALMHHSHLHSYTSFLKIIDHFEQLLLARLDNLSVGISKTDIELINLLSMLSNNDINKNVSLKEKLYIQGTFAAYIWEQRHHIYIKHMMFGLGRMLYSFWKNIVQNQRFLLLQPDFMETMLMKTSHCRSERTVANVLSIASEGIGLHLDKSVKDFIEQALGNEV